MGWHTFRHTCATLLRASGADIKVAQELLRHASCRVILDTYTQAVMEHKRAAQTGSQACCAVLIHNGPANSQKHGSIFIAKSKSGLERTIYLGPEAIEFFKGMVRDRKPAETLFLKADGKPWKQSEQQRPMDKACDDAKIHNFIFHGLRHTFASQYRIAGGPLDVLKDILGHTDLRMTMRYAKIGKSHLQEQSHRYAPVFGLMPTDKATTGTA